MGIVALNQAGTVALAEAFDEGFAKGRLEGMQEMLSIVERARRTGRLVEPRDEDEA